MIFLTKEDCVKTILIADNDNALLKARSAVLVGAGYHVLTAANPEEARRAMLTRNVHLAILDMRLSNDNDASDQSGIALAKDPSLRLIPKIILSAYIDKNAAIDALTPDGNKLPPTVSVVEKDKPIPFMLNKINEVFETFVKIGWDLKIEVHPKEMLVFPGLAASLEPEIAYEQIGDRAQNLEDLFRKLFVQEKRIVLEKLLWHQGGRLALLVVACTGNSKKYSVVTCKSLGPPEAGKSNPESTPAPHSFAPAGLQQEQSIFYAVSAMRLVETDPEEMATLASFVTEKNEVQEKAAVEDLLNVVLRQWKLGNRTVEPGLELAAYYRQRFEFTEEAHPYERLAKNIGRLLEEGEKRSLIGHSHITPGELSLRFSQVQRLRLPNPLQYAYAEAVLPILPVVWADSPGGVEIDTVLVNAGGKALLTDFSQAGRFPICHDYTVLYLSRLNAWLNYISLADLVGVEGHLKHSLTTDKEARLKEVESRYKKTANLLLSIGDEALQLSDSDPRSFDLSLMFYALAGLLPYSPDAYYSKRQLAVFLNRLILAGILCEKIEEEKDFTVPVEEPVARHEELTVDAATKVVKIGGRIVKLTDTEYKILKYLYDNKGTVCSKEDIARFGIGVKSPADSDTDSRLVNTNLDRMRDRISPAYLVTVWGEGIKLITRPE